MNTGKSFATTLLIDFLDKEENYTYSEEFSLLNSFADYKKLSEREFVELEINEVKERAEALLKHISDSKSISFEIVNENTVDIENTTTCPLINTLKENITLSVETTLYRDTINAPNIAFFETSFDGVELKEDTEYFLHFLLTGTEKSNSHIKSEYSEEYDYNEFFSSRKISIDEIDYHKSVYGELMYKAGKERSQIVFDMNDRGELIVIGEDADAYSINELGELIYDIHYKI